MMLNKMAASISIGVNVVCHLRTVFVSDFSCVDLGLKLTTETLQTPIAKQNKQFIVEIFVQVVGCGMIFNENLNVRILSAFIIHLNYVSLDCALTFVSVGKLDSVWWLLLL